MNKKMIGSYGIIWMLVVVLFVCVCLTAFAFFNIMRSYLPDDSGAISLIPENVLVNDTFDTTTVTDNTTQQTQQSETTTTPPETTKPADISVGGADIPSVNDTSAPVEEHTTQTNATTRRPGNPSFEVGDDKTVWSTNTQVEIFKVSYVNGEKVVSVKSADGDKVIAPGTENTYIFKLKNTGDVPLEYTVDIDVKCEPLGIEIPVVARLCRYDGTWIVGDNDSYVSASVLDTANDKESLDAGNYTYYTLDWQWPFEGGNDEFDTLLGNMAVGEDLTFTIVINTTATETDEGGGITPPQTGDDYNIIILPFLAVASFVMIVVLINYRKRVKETD